MRRRALLYCTFNGVANCTNGIGRQSQTLLSAFDNRWDELTAASGTFTPFIAIPTPSPRTWAYDPTMLAAADRVITRRGGQIIPLVHDINADIWTVRVWRQLSGAAAAAARRLAKDFDQVAVIAVDTPFAGTGRHLLDDAPETVGDGDIRTLLALYGTALLHRHPVLDHARLAWERSSLTATGHPRTRAADIGAFLTTHLATEYGLASDRFVRWRSSLDLTAADLQPMPRCQAAETVGRYRIPLDRPIVLTIARTDRVKGTDLLIDALGPLRDRVHLVAIVIPFDGHDPLLEDYRRRIAVRGLRATLVTDFTRDLPRALASLPTTRAVACPSRAETLANVPFEVGLWARHGGPIVCAPARDGFLEQITHRHNGLTYDPADNQHLTDALATALEIPDGVRRGMCQAAFREVIAKRDVVTNLGETLRWLFPASGRAWR